MTKSIVTRQMLFGGKEVVFKDGDGAEFKAYEADGSPVEPYLIGISLFHGKMDVCPHMVKACCNFDKDEDRNKPVFPEASTVRLACRDCLDIKDMDSLVMASWHAGTNYMIRVVKFTDGLYGCYLASTCKMNDRRVVSFQGMGYECVSHWQRIARESGFKVITPLKDEHLEEMKLAFVTDRI